MDLTWAYMRVGVAPGRCLRLGSVEIGDRVKAVLCRYIRPAFAGRS